VFEHEDQNVRVVRNVVLRIWDRITTHEVALPARRVTRHHLRRRSAGHDLVDDIEQSDGRVRTWGVNLASQVGGNSGSEKPIMTTCTGPIIAFPRARCG
jgi:hypothetical protein